MKLSLANDWHNLVRDETAPLMRRGAPLWLAAGFWISIVISVAAVLRRLIAIAQASRTTPPQVGALDAVFASHAALTLAHIVPAMVFVLLTPFVFLRRTGGAWAERLLFPTGTIVGVTAFAMSTYAVGGWVERSAVVFFNSLFLFSLARAYGYRRSGEDRLKRRWMVRAVGILLGIATTRPVMAIFFVTRQLTHLELKQFFGLAFWIGFSINTIAVELWLNSKSHTKRMAARSEIQL